MKIVRFEVERVRPATPSSPCTPMKAWSGLGAACVEGKSRVVETAVRDFE